MRSLSLTLLFAALVANPLWGQDPETDPPVIDPPVQSRAMVISSTSDSEDGGEPVMNMQFMSTDSSGGMFISEGASFSFGGPGFGATSDPFSMLSIPDIQGDIELVPEQLQQINDIRKDFSARMQKEIESFREEGFKADQGKGLGDMIQKMKSEQTEAMEKILLPHQLERLKQIGLQSRMKNAGASGVLADQKLAEELGIDDEQKARIRDRAAELAKDLQEKIEALREQTREELLKELTADQREKLKAMIGEKFEGKTQPTIELPKRTKQRLEKKSDQSDQ